MNRARKTMAVVLSASAVLIAGCSAPGNTAQIPKTSASSSVTSDVIASASTSANQELYEVVSFKVDGKKVALADGAEIVIPEPPKGGTIHAIGFCSSPAFKVDDMNAKSWNINFPKTQSASGCSADSSLKLTNQLKALLIGNVQVERSDSSLSFSQANYELKVSKKG